MMSNDSDAGRVDSNTILDQRAVVVGEGLHLPRCLGYCSLLGELTIVYVNSQVRPLQKIENGHEAQQTSVQKQAHLSFSFQV